MSNKDSKDLALASGICTIGGAIAHAKKSKQWKTIHTFFTLAGAGLTIYAIVA